MSIPKNKSHSEKLELLTERYYGECLVSEAELHDIINTLPVTDWEDFASRMQVFVDVTTAPIENEADEIDKSALKLIKQVTRESEGKSYRQVMEAMMTAIEQGGKGITLAHQTASVAVDLVFIWTPEYFSALRLYAYKLRNMRQKAKSRM